MIGARPLAEVVSHRKWKWAVLALWLLIGVVTLPYLGKLQEVTTDDVTSFLPRTAESTQLVEAERVFEGSGDLELTVVYRREARLTLDDRLLIERHRAELMARYQQPAEDVPIVPSNDARASLINLSVPGITDDDAQVAEVDAVRQLVGDGEDGLEVKVTGPGAFVADAEKVYEGIDLRLLGFSAAVVAVLLLITYRSPVLWLLPLITVAVGDAAASAIVYVLAEGGAITLDGQTAGILPVLVFGVGTDYALLLIARYRTELRAVADEHAAMVSAVRRTLPAMVASGATVIAALLCLFASELNSNRALAPVGALSVAFTLVAVVTLLPPLMLAGGRRMFWPFVPRAGQATADTDGWRRLAAGVARRPGTIAAVTVAVLALASTATFRLDPGLRITDTFTVEPDSVQGQELIAQSFAGGAAEPLLVVADTRELTDVRVAMAAVPEVANVVEIDRTPPGPNADCAPDPDDLTRCLDLNGRTELAVTLSTVPGSAAERQAVRDVRTAVHAVAEAGALVGGSPAQALDLAETSARDRMVVIPLVLAVILVILVVLLRAFVAAAVLIATVVLSFAAALGVSVLVFRHVFGFPNEDPGLVLLAFIFLVALGVDYNIFLATRIREEAQNGSTVEATQRALTATGGVITSAGAVLAATFAILAVLPVVAITELGFLVAFGILLDTFVVRSLLVPALFVLLRERVWWPGTPGRG